MSRHKSTTICMADLKQASLYFDRVIPINPIELINYYGKPLSNTYSIEEWEKDRWLLLDESLNNNQDLIASLAFTEKLSKFEKQSFLKSLSEITRVLQFQGMTSVPTAFFNASYIMNHYHPVQQHLAAESFLKNDKIDAFHDVRVQNIVSSFYNKLGFEKFHGVRVQDIVSSFYNKFGFENVSPFLPISHVGEGEGGIMVTLAEMNLVDVEKTSIEEIKSFREKPESREKFQKLRRFSTLNLDGKSKIYIEDTLAKCIDDYEDACKEHGFQTSQSMLSTVVKSKTALAAAGTGIAGILATITGAQIDDFSTQIIGAGAAYDLAGILLQVRESNHGYERIMNTNSCGYIISAKNTFNQS